MPFIIFALLLFFSVTSAAEVLAPGKMRLRTALAFATGSGLWVGDTKKGLGLPTPSGSQGPSLTSTSRNSTFATSPTSSDSPGSLTSFVNTTSASFGIPFGLQLDAHMVYNYTKYSGGDEANVADGDYEGGIAEIGFRANKSIVENALVGDGVAGLVGYFGVRAPGNASKSADDFLAINDGATKFDLGVRSGVRFQKVSFEADMALILRPDNTLGQQFSFNFFVPVNVVEGFTFGPSVGFFTTFQGVDIDDEEFKAIEQDIGAPPFSQRKESFMTLGVFAGVPIDEEFSLDFAIQAKAAGRNTASGATIAAGVSYDF